jgi:putative phage-type endonuclease
MKQNTPEWYAARKSRITGSNVGAILGLNPYRTAEDVLRAMVRDYHNAESEFTGNAATAHGSFHEDGAVIDYQMVTGHNVQECGFIVHPEHEWLGASPDRFVGNDGLLEIKCPYSQREKLIPEFKSAKAQPHYFAQMQIEMACAQRSWCDFFQWSPSGADLARVFFDAEWFADALPKLRGFYDLYLSEVDNPDHLKPRSQPPLMIIEHEDARKIIDEISDLSELIERATARKKEVMDELVVMCGKSDALVCGHKLTLVEKEGAVSYAKVVKEHCANVDLEPYRGKPSSFWKLT